MWAISMPRTSVLRVSPAERRKFHTNREKNKNVTVSSIMFQLPSYFDISLWQYKHSENFLFKCGKAKCIVENHFLVNANVLAKKWGIIHFWICLRSKTTAAASSVLPGTDICQYYNRDVIIIFSKNYIFLESTFILYYFHAKTGHYTML